MKNRRPSYIYDTIRFPLSEGTVLKGNVEELVDYLWENGNIVTDELNRLSRDGVIDDIVSRYLDGETYLTSKTSKTRDVFTEYLDIDVFPSYKTRRWIDIALFRVEQIIKGQAIRKYVHRLISNNKEKTGAEIAQLFYQDSKRKIIPSELDVPTAAQVENVISHHNNTEDWVSRPTFDFKIPLSTEDRICSLIRYQEHVVLHFALPNKEAVELQFVIPNRALYLDGVMCRPDVIIDNDELCFIFSVKHSAPKPYVPLVDVPVDLNVLLPFTTCVMCSEWRSQIIYPDKKIMKLLEKKNAISLEKDNLIRKMNENLKENRQIGLQDKACQQQMNIDNLKSKIHNLSEQIADLVAHRVCEIAINVRGRIVLEHLAFVPQGTEFIHGIMQKNILSLAWRLGIPCVFVGCAHTSTQCPKCGSAMIQNQPNNSPVKTENASERRGVECPECGYKSHHDAISPYNIGKRSLDCDFPTKYVRIRFRRLRWSNLSFDLAADSARNIAPVQDFQITGLNTCMSFREWCSQSGNSPLLA